MYYLLLRIWGYPSTFTPVVCLQHISNWQHHFLCSRRSTEHIYIGHYLYSFHAHVTLFRSLMPPFHTDHESHESPRIGFVRIRGILQISCPNRDALIFCYDTGTIDLRIFVGFGSNRSNIVTNLLRFTRIGYEYCKNGILGISYESVKNMPNASTNQVILKLNSWLFLTMHGISPQDRYKKAL